MLKSKIRKEFDFKGRNKLEFVAEIFGEKKNNMSIVLSSTAALKPGDTAFVLGFMLLEICNDCGLDFDDVINKVFEQINETDESLN